GDGAAERNRGLILVHEGVENCPVLPVDRRPRQAGQRLKCVVGEANALSIADLPRDRDGDRDVIEDETTFIAFERTHEARRRVQILDLLRPRLNGLIGRKRLSHASCYLDCALISQEIPTETATTSQYNAFDEKRFCPITKLRSGRPPGLR